MRRIRMKIFVLFPRSFEVWPASDPDLKKVQDVDRLLVR